jgi:hypothetical protein
VLALRTTANLPYNHPARVDTYPHRKTDIGASNARVEVFQPIYDPQRSTYRALGVVFVRPGVAEVTLGQNDPDKVVLLYATDGVLWGTLSPTVRADRAALRDYFVTAFKVLPGLKVTFGEQLIRVYGGTAVNTGYYTFSYIKDGETKTLPARYSFTFVKEGENWMIVDHHSSAMPVPPR